MTVPLHKHMFAALELPRDEKITRGERARGEFRQRDENRLDLGHQRTERGRREESKEQEAGLGEGGKGWSRGWK